LIAFGATGGSCKLRIQPLTDFDKCLPPPPTEKVPFMQLMLLVHPSRGNLSTPKPKGEWCPFSQKK